MLRHCVPLILLFSSVSANAADNFQPHPSHMPPPPQAVVPPPVAPPNGGFPKLLKVVPPEYPDRARRFNATSTIRVRIHVRPNGSVERVETMNGNVVFVESVRRAVAKWKFEKRDEPSIVQMAIPFKLTDNGEVATDTAIRKLVRAPKSAHEVGKELDVGFAYVRLLIDSNGAVKDRFFTSEDPESFLASANDIVDKLEFAPVGPEDPPQPNGSINFLLIDHAIDGVIRVQQRRGD